jgi:hypothetical protein
MTARHVLGLTNLLEPRILVVEADYEMQYHDQRLDIVTPGVLVTLPQEPTVGLTNLLYGSNVAWRISGGAAHPLPIDPLPILAGENLQPVFSTSGWQLGRVVPAPPASTGLMKHTVFVAKNGVDATADGSVGKPFLTVQAAMEYAWTTYVLPLGPQPAPPFTRPCVFVNAGTYDDGDLVLPPQICVEGEGFNHSRIKGNWDIDERWSNYVPASLPSPPSVLVPNDFRSTWLNIGLFGDVNIDFNLVFSNEGKLYAEGVRFAGNVTISEKLPNPVSNSLTCISCEILADLTLKGIPTVLLGCATFGGTITLNQATGTGVDNLFESSGGSLGNIVVNAVDEFQPPYGCKFNHSVQADASLTLNGLYINVQADVSSVPLQSLITLLAGAKLDQIKRLNQQNFSGLTPLRPTVPYVGQPFFDTTIGKPIWWNGASWIDAAGAVV